MASTGDTTTPVTASTSSSTTKVEIIQRQRERSGSASSQSSLGNTIDFYGLNTKPSIERFNRPSSPPTTTSSPPPTSPRSHTANILPSASFFNPKRATSDLTAVTNTTSQRRGNGPLITRVASAIGDSPSLAQATPTGRASPIPSTSGNLAGGSGRRYSYAAGDASDDEVDSQVGAGGLSAARLARIISSQSQERSSVVGGVGAGGWGGSRSSFEQLGGGVAGSIGRSSFDHDRGASSSSLGHGHAQHDSSSSAGHAPPQASRDQLIYGDSTPRVQQGASPRVADYPEGNGSGIKEGAIARARASFSGSPRESPREEQGGWGGSSTGHGGGGGVARRAGGGVQLMDVETSGEYDREPKTSSSPTSPTSRPAPQQQQHTTVSLVPLVDASGRKVRNYQLHPGSNRFFLQGRVLSSRDNPTPFLLSLALAILLPVLFFAFSGPFLWSHLGGGGKASVFVFVYMCAVMWTNMCKTAWRDPGIVPRNLDLTPERKWVDDLHGPGEGNGGWRAEPRYMRIGEGVVASKWCETCETYRPPRTSHCRLCDNCVDHTDHHCTFLNNCIGRRNYTSFIAFLASSILCAVYALSFSAWHIARRHALAQDGEAWASRWDVAGSFVVAVLSFALLCPIAGLMGYHMRLLWSNRTTIEMLRPKGDRSGAINPANGKAMGNLYSLQSPFANIVSLLCRPMEIPSWIEPHHYATKDAREEQEGQGNKEREGAV